MPIWFQIVKDASPGMSTIMNLPLVISVGIAFTLSNNHPICNNYSGIRMVVSSIMTASGAGFMTRFTVATSKSTWICLQILLGSGVGLGLDTAFRIFRSFGTIQEVTLWVHERAFVTSMLLSTAAIFTSVAQSIFVSTVLFGLRRDIPDFNTDHILLSGFSRIREVMTEEQPPVMLSIFNSAFVDVFYLTTALAIFSVIGGLFAPCKVPLASRNTYLWDTLSSFDEELLDEPPTWGIIFDAVRRFWLCSLGFFHPTYLSKPDTWNSNWRDYLVQAPIFLEGKTVSYRVVT
jgi:hypothetical protein